MNASRFSYLLIILTVVILFAGCQNQPQPRGNINSIENRLKERLEGFHGRVGLYVEDLVSGSSITINADSVFPTASMIKIPILAALFDRFETDSTLQYQDIVTYEDSLLYEGEDILGSFRAGESIAISKLVMLMITMSDNTASLWLQHLAGTGTRINEWLSDNGFQDTRMNSRTPGRESAREVYGWGQTTPREMARLVTMIARGEAVSPAASEEMYRTLTRIYWNDESLSQVPPGIQVASKQGAVDASRSEVVFVNAPSGDYVFCLITDDQADQSWEHSNEGFVLLRDVSRMLWSHFEPGSNWQPADGMQRYWTPY